MAEARGNCINAKKRANSETLRESQQDTPECSAPLIRQASPGLEEVKRNGDFDSMIDTETDGAEKVECISEETDDEVEQVFRDWGRQISQDQLKFRFRDAVKRSTLRKIESLIIESEELNREVRRLRGAMVDVQVLLKEVESWRIGC
ncbi:hypothetical protein EAF04_000870 [Stromatinia cepivora]|nr:hypothetical protein EAF04_000870 [Stromatinia cepivora]